MAGLHETRASLRFFGDDLDPDEITNRLGQTPSVGAHKGGLWRTGNGTEKVARYGFWRLGVPDRKPGDLEGQISELLSCLSADLSIWQDLTTRFEANIFCGLFMFESNEGLSLSANIMMELAARNLSIGFDIYDPDKDS